MAISSIISGAFTLNSTGRTSIAQFVADNPRVLSGGAVYVLPDANTSKLWIGIISG